MRLLTRLLDRLRAVKSSPVARKRQVNTAIRWALWSPQNALKVILAVSAVVLVGVGIFTFRASMAIQQGQYEAAVAAHRAAEASASATTDADTDYSLANADKRATATPTPTTSTAKPTPTPKPTVVTPAPSPTSVEAAPQAAAREFLAAWTAAAKAPSQNAWIESLRPTTSPALLDLFRNTDRSKVPAAAIASLTSVTVPELRTSHVSAQMKGLGTVTVVLEQNQADGRWRVVDVAPEGS